jgi:hypothetical protein
MQQHVLDKAKRVTFQKHTNAKPMKRTFSFLLKGLAITLLFAGSSRLAQAQASDNATLNVVLADVRSITVNPAQNAVQLNFATATDYQTGVISNQVGHLIVTSTGGFQVKVKASGETLVNGANSIPVNTITLSPSINAGSTLPPGATFVNVQLSSVPQPIIQSTNGSANVIFDVEYKASGGDPYINKPAGTYVTTITYSIEPA